MTTLKPQAPAVLGQLRGGDRRSIGRSNEVVAAVLAKPELLGDLFAGLDHRDPLVRMRTADALEKVGARYPAWLAPYKNALLRRLASPENREVHWHLVQMAPRLPLSDVERHETIAVLKGYLSDDSRIVRTCAMQAIAELSEADPKLRDEAIRLLEKLTLTGSLAMQAREHKLLARLAAAKNR